MKIRYVIEVELDVGLHPPVPLVAHRNPLATRGAEEKEMNRDEKLEQMRTFFRRCESKDEIERCAQNMFLFDISYDRGDLCQAMKDAEMELGRKAATQGALKMLTMLLLLPLLACGSTHPADGYCDTACSKAAVCFNLPINEQHDCYDACIHGMDNMATQCDWAPEDVQAFSDASTGALRGLTCAAFADVLFALQGGVGGACP